MSNSSERIKGKAAEVGGTIMRTVGKVIGNDVLETKGTLKELEGEARQEVAKAAERRKGTAEEVTGSFKAAVGKAIGNEKLQVEGKAKKLGGGARKELNR